MAEVMAAPIDFSASAAYAARAFLDETHLQTLHRTLPTCWGQLNSLSAALQLMKAHGVELSAEDEQELAQQDEATQISMLVQRMPTQSSDDFQHFFLKLQLLVSTATTLRQALEEGDAATVINALEDSESTGITTYLLRVAIVQAGSQAATLKDTLKDFARQADEKMGGLVRGQQDSMAASKNLAAAQAKLSSLTMSVTSKRGPMVSSFCARGDAALLKMTWQAWWMSTQQAITERNVEDEFKERVKKMEEGMAEWKVKQLQNRNGAMMRQIMEANARLLGDIFGLWHDVASAERTERETAAATADFQAKLAAAQASSIESAKRLVAKMQGASAESLAELCLTTWKTEAREARERRELDEAAKAAEAKKAAVAQEKLEASKGILQAFSSGQDGTLMGVVFMNWKDAWKEMKYEAELAAAIAEKASSLTSWGGRAKSSGLSAMERAAEHMDDMLLLRTLNCWKLYASMERCGREHHNSINAKRQQLLGVQQMFRTFAEQLDSGTGKDTSRFEYSDRSPPSPSKSRSKAHHAGSKESRMSRQGNSVSLPDIHKPSSRPASRGMSRPSSGAGVAIREGM